VKSLRDDVSPQAGGGESKASPLTSSSLKRLGASAEHFKPLFCAVAMALVWRGAISVTLSASLPIASCERL